METISIPYLSNILPFYKEHKFKSHECRLLSIDFIQRTATLELHGMVFTVHTQTDENIFFELSVSD